MLKSFLTFSLICLSFSSYAMPAYDGCYQLQVFPEENPVICISGTLEEGTGGAGVRAFFFDPYLDGGKCFISTGLIMNEKELVLLEDDNRELVFTNFETPEALAGDIMGGDIAIPFKKLSESASGPVMEAARRADCH